MTPKRYFFIVLLFLYIPLFIKGYANTTNEFSDVNRSRISTTSEIRK